MVMACNRMQWPTESTPPQPREGAGPAVPYTTHPGGGKETEAHASARAAVRAAATAACAALAPCDILQSPPPGGDQPFTPGIAHCSVRVTAT
jgi:hypothetical protein